MRITLTKMLPFRCIPFVVWSSCRSSAELYSTIRAQERVRIRQIFFGFAESQIFAGFQPELENFGEFAGRIPKNLGFDSSDSTDQGHQNSIRRFNIRCRTRAHSPFPSSSYQRCHIKHPKGCANVWCAMVDLSCQQKGIIAWCHCRANSHKLTLSEEDSLLKHILDLVIVDSLPGLLMLPIWLICCWQEHVGDNATVKPKVATNFIKWQPLLQTCMSYPRWLSACFYAKILRLSMAGFDLSAI